MFLLSRDELQRYRQRFLCSLNRLAGGLSEKPVNADDVYNDIGINAYQGAEPRAADSLVQNAVERGFVSRGTGRKISLTVEGVKWCRERCK